MSKDLNFVFIQFSNSRSICGVWDYNPSDKDRAKEYSKYMKQEMDIDTTRWNTWIEKHNVIK